MTKQTNQPTGTSAGPTVPLSVTELTTLLQMVNQLFPLPERPAKLSTREGRAYKQAVAQRDAYIKALQAAISHATTENRLRQEMDLVIAGHDTDAASYAEQIRNLERCVDHAGPFMLVAFQLALLLQRRPEIVTKRRTYGDGNMIDLNLGDLRVNVFGDQQSIQLTAPGLRSRSFSFDDQGNLLEGDLDRMIGYLTRAGYDIDPENAKKVLSQGAQSRYYADPRTSKADAMSSAIGRIAMQGAGLTQDYLSNVDPVTLMRGKPSAVNAMTDALRRQFGDNLGLDEYRSSLHKQTATPGAPGMDFIVIITDGMSHPGDQKG